jgi:predicted ester cyclase
MSTENVRFVERLRGAFPDIEVTIEQMIEQGDLIASRWVAQMTHEGNHLGPEPTHKRVAVTGMSIARIQNGTMVEGWNNWDMLSLMDQIGGLKPMATLMLNR